MLSSNLFGDGRDENVTIRDGHVSCSTLDAAGG